MTRFKSDLSNLEFPIREKVRASSVRPAILEVIRREHPGFTENACLAISELNIYRQKYISELLTKELGELSQLESKVISSLGSENTLVGKLEEQEDGLTFGQKVADNVAEFGGSWRFIISFGVFLLGWIALNVFWLRNQGFDPFPFILLNLILSCLAALQAPVIMMSQNRQEDKDRQRAKKDYIINLKSELEIRMLHEKIDHLIMHQQQELIEIQHLQVEMMNDILDRIGQIEKP